MAAMKSKLEDFKNWVWRSRNTKSNSEDSRSVNSDDSPSRDRGDARVSDDDNGNFSGIRLEDFNSAEFPEGQEDSAQVGGSENIYLNTQALGNVINVINSTGVHVGDLHIIYANEPGDRHKNAPGTSNFNPAAPQTQRTPHRRQRSNTSQSSDSSNEGARKPEYARSTSRRSTSKRQSVHRDIPFEITADIKVLMDSQIKPPRDFLRHISWGLGVDRKIFYNLGYNDKFIDTTEYDAQAYGVREARFRILLDWTCNDNVGTLGVLATKLWETGEFEIVQELAEKYKKDTLLEQGVP